MLMYAGARAYVCVCICARVGMSGCVCVFTSMLAYVCDECVVAEVRGGGSGLDGARDYGLDGARDRGVMFGSG